MKKIILIIILICIFQRLEAQETYYIDSTEIKTDSVGIILKTLENNHVELMSDLKEIERLDSLDLLTNTDYFRISQFIISNKILEGYEFVFLKSFKYTWSQYQTISHVMSGQDHSVLYNVLQVLQRLGDQGAMKNFLDYIYRSEFLNKNLTKKEVRIIKSYFPVYYPGSYNKLRYSSERHKNLKMIFNE